MDTNDILRASLFGSKIIKEAPKFEQIENRFGKHVLPVLNVKGEIVKMFDKGRNDRIAEVSDDQNSKFSARNWEDDAFIDNEGWKEKEKKYSDKHFFPLVLSIDDGKTWFTLPYEPILNIEGKNKIITRSVLKYNNSAIDGAYGTVKERWSTDDYKISITGILVGKNQLGEYDKTFPKEDFQQLKEYLLYAKEVRVKSPPLELLGINYIAIESFSFPFTKGENVQAYTINAMSDVKTDLIIKPKSS